MAHYDDPKFSYQDYWQPRQYEHRTEVMAINRLLRHRIFSTAADIGGGFGRLTKNISLYSRHTYLIEPSKKLRTEAQEYLHNDRKITFLPGTAQHTGLPDQCLDLVSIVRVFHHIPHLQPVFVEITRILKPGGFLLLEFANSLNFKARIASLITGQPILLIPQEKRSTINIRRQSIPFVNHHPAHINQLLNNYGFRVQKTLSVSNFRSPFLKKLIPIKFMLFLESLFSSLLSVFYFGPSIFILAAKDR